MAGAKFDVDKQDQLDMNEISKLTIGFRSVIPAFLFINHFPLVSGTRKGRRGLGKKEIVTRWEERHDLRSNSRERRKCQLQTQKRPRRARDTNLLRRM